MPYTRRILHYLPGPTDFVAALSDSAVAGCWFELHRMGGCGAGELQLKETFPQRHAVDVGDWIALEFDTGERWYLGRVEHRQASSPAGVTLRLEGMGIELNEAFPGGFSPSVGDGTPPHRYANTDLFSNDPDRDLETFDSVNEPHELIDLLLSQYILPRTNITRDPVLIESSLPRDVDYQPSNSAAKNRLGRSSKSLPCGPATHRGGVNQDGEFFFLRQPNGTVATYQEGVDVVSLAESRERDLLFNRIVLTGGYIYDRPRRLG